MEINKKWLKSVGACDAGVKWGYEKFGEKATVDSAVVIDALIKDDKFSYANWFIIRIMTREQRLRYAIFSSEQVIDICEKEYLDDDLPRKAIESAKAVLKSDTIENRAAADIAADAAYAAAARDDVDAYAAAARAARAASTDAVYAYSNAVTYAAIYAAETRLKILNYGKTLLSGEYRGV